MLADRTTVAVAAARDGIEQRAAILLSTGWEPRSAKNSRSLQLIVDRMAIDNLTTTAQPYSDYRRRPPMLPRTTRVHGWSRPTRPAVMPPSITSSEPVTWRDASEAR